jgi:hypothetical protein
MIPDHQNPTGTELFKTEDWYREAPEKETTFSGLVTKEDQPEVTVNRQLAYRIGGKPVYVGGVSGLLEAYVGKTVQVTGKEVKLLGVPEIWPGDLKVIG